LQRSINLGHGRFWKACNHWDDQPPLVNRPELRKIDYGVLLQSLLNADSHADGIGSLLVRILSDDGDYGRRRVYVPDIILNNDNWSGFAGLTSQDWLQIRAVDFASLHL
jgi:hypothetical protein